ncbi:MAG: TonB-dependent receptor plug domain-containing protein, partial [Bacteroidales bacterium]|nr:TonB-dependent receptor plug domain-containing protein [Bacteroidales bacterium]
SFLATAQNHRIYGIIKDAISGEVLIGANIYDTLSLRGTVSSKDGFYSLELKSPTSFIIYTYVGYKNRALKLNRINDTLINIFLTPGKELDEVSISPKKENISVYSISKEQLVNTAVLGGEPDLMKYLQLLPGIQPGNEGTGNIHVRGGGPGENLVLLDRVPLYYINHLGGFVSIFNPYIIHNASIYTGNFPAEYGGRISSALDVTMKDGNVEKIKGEASIGLISSKIAMDGPLKNEKLSFVLSARRTYLDAFLVPFFKLVSPKASLGYNFYDLNGKINYRMNEKNTFQVSAYFGDDRLSYKHKDDSELYSMKNIWGNSFISFQHKSILNSAIQVTNQLIFSRYRLKTTHLLELDETNDREKIEDHKFFFSGIRDAGIRSDWLINMSSSWDVKTGLHLFYHKFAPAVEGDIIHNKGSFFNIRDLESNYYLDNLFYVTDKLDIRGGMRVTAYKKTEKTWFLTEPRFSTTYRIKENISFISAWSRMYQFVHQLKSTGNTLNPEIWLPVMENLP